MKSTCRPLRVTAAIVLIAAFQFLVAEPSWA
jgi:hypothetical protein